MSECPCPTCQGRRLKKGGPGGDRREPEYRRILPQIRHRRPGFCGSSDPDGNPGPDCPADPQGDPLPPDLPAKRGAVLSDPQPPGGPPVRRREPADSAGHPDRLLPHGGCCTFWTSPPSACTSGTTTCFWTPSSACGTWATPSLWWSTTRTPCGPRTTLWDIGPAAGVHGGQVIAAGTAEEIMAVPASITGQYLSGAKKFRSLPPPDRQRAQPHHSGAAENNLDHVDVTFPLGTFTCVTGVSGSGKSSLVNEILFKRLGADLNRMKVRPGKHTALEGEEFLDKVIDIDQSPIGRTPRSNPATYTGLFGDIRELFASTPDAKSRGYGPGRFSFNVKGRPVRVLRRGWTAENRDALSPRYLRSLRGLQGKTLQPGDPGGQVQGKKHPRCPGHDRG